jgi:choline dehydrogenase-like flavoprotein
MSTSSSHPSYDVVIVGSGIIGAILAWNLAKAGKHVLILEAGVDAQGKRGDFVGKYHRAGIKTPESPYPDDNVNAPRPRSDVDAAGLNNPSAYWIQRGPQPFGSCYERQAGGTTWHWLGLMPRMLPADFTLASQYGVGVDWPIDYADLEPFYRAAEQQVGVAGDVALQKYCGLWFGEDYQYPMAGVPPSYSDQRIQARLGGLRLLGNDVYLTPTPAARNTSDYDERRACQGNTSCIPICPIQAKYDATIHLARAQQLGAELWCQTVVDRVLVDDAGRVSGVSYIRYDTPNQPGGIEPGVVRARVYVLAAHAIETPKILLNSRTGALPRGAANRSDQVGRNLMDHPFPLNWGLMPEPVYPMRGPRVTSGIETLRDGPFRRRHASFRVDIGNEGWTWANDDPDGSVNALVQKQGLFGSELRRELHRIGTHAVRIGFLIEQLPIASNRVTLGEQLDALGIPRPQIEYDIDEYCRRGFVEARKVAQGLFARLGVDDRTSLLWATAGDPGTFEVDGDWYQFFGAGHIVGTYRMGTDPATSVVDSYCRSHDHENLFLCGTGVMPTIGTSNPTNTAVAIALRAFDSILKAAG